LVPGLGDSGVADERRSRIELSVQAEGRCEGNGEERCASDEATSRKGAP